jgi:hypothetical protein
MRKALDPGEAPRFRDIPPVADPGALPENLSVPRTDLLAARASDHLPAALEGDPEPSTARTEGTLQAADSHPFEHNIT